jgi:hypothetical protein
MSASTSWEAAMRRVRFVVAVLLLLGAMGGALTACGDDDEDKTTTAEATSTEAGDGTGTATSGAVETTPGGAVVPAAPSCAQGQIYSQGRGACVAERQGKNPCPSGEIPAADQPVCELKE